LDDIFLNSGLTRVRSRTRVSILETLGYMQLPACDNNSHDVSDCHYSKQVVTRKQTDGTDEMAVCGVTLLQDHYTLHITAYPPPRWWRNHQG